MVLDQARGHCSGGQDCGGQVKVRSQIEEVKALQSRLFCKRDGIFTSSISLLTFGFYLVFTFFTCMSG
jgi:hypothetical protein